MGDAVKIKYPENTCFVPALKLDGDCTGCRYEGVAKCSPVYGSRRAGRTQRSAPAASQEGGAGSGMRCSSSASCPG